MAGITGKDRISPVNIELHILPFQVHTVFRPVEKKRLPPPDVPVISSRYTG
jgi:hypothetical protein